MKIQKHPTLLGALIGGTLGWMLFTLINADTYDTSILLLVFVTILGILAAWLTITVMKGML